VVEKKVVVAVSARVLRRRRRRVIGVCIFDFFPFSLTHG